MPDFSHIRATTAEMLVGYIQSGGLVTDEMLLEAAERITPRFLTKAYMVALRKELAVGVQRRGRPSKLQPTRIAVAENIAKLKGLGDIRPFLDTLANRLRNGEGLSNLELARRANSKHAKTMRNMMMAALYDSFRIQDTDGSSLVVHPILGSFEILFDRKDSRHERVLKLTDAALRQLGEHPPSLPAMKNIISMRRRPGNSRRKM